MQMADLPAATYGDPSQLDDSFAQALLGRGLDSTLATWLAAKYGSWAELKGIVATNDMIDGLAPDDLRKVKRAMERRDIPSATVKRLIHECEFRCCLCWNLDAANGVV